MIIPGCKKIPACLPNASKFLCWSSRSPCQLACQASKVEPDLVTSHCNISSLSEDNCLLLFTVGRNGTQKKKEIWASRINSRQVDLSHSLPQGEAKHFFFTEPCHTTNSHYTHWMRMYFLDLGVKGLIHCTVYSFIPDNFVGLRVFNMFRDYPQVRTHLESELDIDSRVLGTWRSLAGQFGLPKSKVDQFGKCIRGPTEKLFDYLEFSGKKEHSALKGEELKAHLRDMQRKDVLLLLDHYDGKWMQQFSKISSSY